MAATAFVSLRIPPTLITFTLSTRAVPSAVSIGTSLKLGGPSRAYPEIVTVEGFGDHHPNLCEIGPCKGGQETVLHTLHCRGGRGRATLRGFFDHGRKGKPLRHR